MANKVLAAAVVGAVFAAATPALAATNVAFGTHNNMGTTGSTGNVIGTGTAANPYFVSADGKITASVTGWTTTGTNGTPTKAYVADYSGWGLGVTNYVSPNRDGSPSDQHVIDNNSYFDFVAVTFSSKVTVNQLSLTLFNGADSDYWVSYTNSSDWTSGGQSWTDALGAGKSFDGSVGSSDGQAYTPSAALQNVTATTWFIGAARSTLTNNTSTSYSAQADYFKLRSLAVTAAVPEPATWMTMILGFGAIGGALRRRRQSALATA